MENKLVNLIVNDSLSSIYLCDEKSYELLYVNERAAKTVKKTVAEAAGKKCYEYLEDRTEPCENCFMRECGDEGFTVKEYTSKTTGRSYLARAKTIVWQGSRAMLKYLTDETERIETQRMLNGFIDGLPGGAGIYYLYKDGLLDCVYMNNGFYELIGVPRDKRAAYFRTNTINAVHHDDTQSVNIKLAQLWTGQEEVSIDYRVLLLNDANKWLNANVNVVSRDEEYLKLYISFSDIDELKRTQLRLESSQRALELAANAQNMFFWLYYLDSHEVSREFRMVSPLNRIGSIAKNVPESIYGTGDIHKDDEPEFRAMYDALFSGARKCECTVRAFNKMTGCYEWQHMLYARLDDKLYGRPAAIGYSTNADVQQEVKHQYQSEQQLRREIIKSSIASYQVNITKRTVEEYSSIIKDRPLLTSGARITPKLRAQLLCGIHEDDKALVRDTLFIDAMKQSYKRGETAPCAVYRRLFEGRGYRWVVSNASIMKRSDTGELIGFIYTRDIDMEKKSSIAIADVLNEDIEIVCIVHAASGMAFYAKAAPYLQAALNKEYVYNERMRLNVQARIHADDQAIYSALYLENLMEKLKLDKDVVTVMYREYDNTGAVKRKKARAYYLDKTHEDIVVIRRDITDLYEEEQQQKKTLEEAAAAANAANRAKSAFVSRMSHDMRTPLNAVLALSGTELTEDLTEAEKDEHLRQIHSSGEYLLGIINDVLDMSRIESRKLTLNIERCAREDFIGTIKTVISEQCRLKGVEFEVIGRESGRDLMLDKVRLKQVLINLLSNAVKFTPEGGKVSFMFDAVSYMDDMALVRFIVKDTGIGMSEEFLPKAFDSFSQENRMAGLENGQGTGLGLSIVKQLVELMNGTIKVSSEVNKGTEFTVVLPLKLADTSAAQSQTPEDEAGASRAELSGARVLLCEDHPLNAKITVSLLKKKGCVTACACNGKEGVDMFMASEPGYFDIVLMDIRMPVMDGIAATHAIRALERSDAASVPIIAMTADAFTEDIQQSLRAGMNGHLTKPVEPEKLYDMLAQELRRSARTRR